MDFSKNYWKNKRCKTSEIAIAPPPARTYRSEKDVFDIPRSKQSKWLNKSHTGGELGQKWLKNKNSHKAFCNAQQNTLGAATPQQTS